MRQRSYKDTMKHPHTCDVTAARFEPIPVIKIKLSNPRWPQIIENSNVFEDIEMELEESKRDNDTDIKITEKL